MPNRFKALLKVQLLSLFPIHALFKESDRKKKRNKILMLPVYVLLIAVFGGYAALTAMGMISMGLSSLIPAVALLVSGLATLIFSTFRAAGDLFSYRHLDLLLSLPLKTSEVIRVRFLSMLLGNILLSLLFMLPMGIVWALSEPLSAVFYLSWFVGILFGSLIPTTLAAILGAGLVFLGSRFKRTNLISIVLQIVLIVGVLTFSFSMPNIVLSLTHMGGDSATGLPDLSHMVSGVMAATERIYPPLRLFHMATLEGNIPALLGFVLLSTAWYGLFVYLLSLKYKNICTALSAKRKRASYALGSLRKTGIVKALYKKDCKRFFTSSVYLLNLGVGAVMALLLAGYVGFSGADALLHLTEGLIPISVISGYLPFVIAGILSMCCTTCVALSIEGKSIWVIKSLPISPRSIYDAKVLVNLTLTIPTAILCGIFVLIGLPINALSAINLFLVPISMSVWTAILGIVINRRFCNYEWESETRLVKQSTASFLGVFSGLILTTVLAIASHYISPLQQWNTFGIGIILLPLSLLLYRFERKRPLP